MPTIEGAGAHSVNLQEAITGDRLFVHVSEAGIKEDFILVSQSNGSDAARRGERAPSLTRSACRLISILSPETRSQSQIILAAGGKSL